MIEDCAHSLGATYKGRMVGTLGDASFFSFQAFKPLNTYGGGLAWMRDADIARRVGEFADAEQWPTEKRVESILCERQVAAHLHPAEGVHLFAVSDLVGRIVHRREAGGAAVGRASARSTRFRSNTAAASRTCRRRSGSPGSSACPSSSSARRRHARMLDEILGDAPGITIPSFPTDARTSTTSTVAYVPGQPDDCEAVHPPRCGRGADARGRVHAYGPVRLEGRAGARRRQGRRCRAGADVRIAVG